MEKVLSSKKVVRFQDCDPFQHLNNANYLHYFINAREDQVKDHYGLDIFALAQEKGINWVVGSNKIAYFRPAVVMETVVIDTQIINYSEQDMVVELRMYDEKKSHIKSVLWIHFIHFDLKTQKRIKHEDEMMELLANVHFPVDQITFDERLLHFRSQKKG